MPHRPVSLHAPAGSVAAEGISARLDALLASADGLPQVFPAGVLVAAEAAAAREPGEHADLREIPFVTLDPESSTDLDQAMHLSRQGAGYRVRYAIADVPFVVDLGGPLDEEARRRGATVYLPDRRIPLHPPVLSEAAASLLPEQDTPAIVWTLDLDPRGEVTAVDLQRAVVRSREKLAYDAVQAELDAGRGHPMMALLAEIGALRTAREAERGGASLKIPEQEVVVEGDRLLLRWRTPHPIEAANAQLSLLTGMVAATLMIEGGSGILRTLPPADEPAIWRFRHQAEALGIDWPAHMPYGELLRGLRAEDPAHLALLNQAGALFRGASYAAFTAPEELPEDPSQAAIAAPYAHTTAPLRRLVDRFVLLVCLAHARGRAPDPALLTALRAIPEAMRATAARAGDLERRALDLVEIAVLEPRVGETFAATVIERRAATRDEEGREQAPTRIEVQLADPPVTAWVSGDARPGTAVRVRLESVDLDRPAAHIELRGTGAA